VGVDESRAPFLAGRRVLVTGAAGEGIGRGTCEAILEAGGSVVVHGRTRESAFAAADALDGAVAVWGDVGVGTQIDAFVEAAFAAFGGLDGLVNNAGVGLNREMLDASEDDYERLFGVDVKGTWLVTRAVGRRWRDGPGTDRAIVNVSSVNAFATFDGYGLYAAGKAAVNGLTRGMAVELGTMGIRCNAVAPGYVESEQGAVLLRSFVDDPETWVTDHIVDQQAIAEPLTRLGCGRLIAYLLSGAARGITGQVIAVDNGLTSLLYNRRFTAAISNTRAHGT